MAKVIPLDCVKAMRYVTITVAVQRRRELGVRIWLALRLFELAATILNCNVKIEDMDEEEDNDNSHCSPASL